MIKHKMKILALTLSAALFLSSCGKPSEVNYDIDDTNTSSGQTSNSQNSTEASATSNDTTDTNQDIPKNLPVIYKEEIEFTADYCKAMADKIFDNGEYKLFPSNIFCDKEMLEKKYEIINEIKPEINNYNPDEFERSYLTDDEISGILDGYEYDITYFLNNDYLSNPPEDSPETIVSDGTFNFYGYTSSEELQIIEVIGKVNGIYTCVDFRNQYGMNIMSMYPFFSNQGLWGISIGGIDSTCTPISKDSLLVPPEGNICMYSEEEAVSIALDYARKYTESDMVVSCVEYNRVMENNSNVCDGYIITLCPNTNSETIKLSDSYDYRHPNISRISSPDDETPIWVSFCPELFKVLVTDNVIMIDYFNPASLKKISNDNTTLLEYSSIKSIIDDNLEELSEIGYNTDVSEITLSYGIQYSEDSKEYALIPCWFAYSNNAGEYFDKTVILQINAIDGSIVNNMEGAGGVVYH